MEDKAAQPGSPEADKEVEELLAEVLDQIENKTELVIDMVDKTRKLRRDEEVDNDLTTVPLMLDTIADCKNIIFKLYRIDEQLSHGDCEENITPTIRESWVEICKARTALEYHAAEIERRYEAGKDFKDLKRRGLQALTHLQNAHTSIDTIIDRLTANGSTAAAEV